MFSAAFCATTPAPCFILSLTKLPFPDSARRKGCGARAAAQHKIKSIMSSSLAVRIILIGKAGRTYTYQAHDGSKKIRFVRLGPPHHERCGWQRQRCAHGKIRGQQMPTLHYFMSDLYPLANIRSQSKLEAWATRYAKRLGSSWHLYTLYNSGHGCVLRLQTTAKYSAAQLRALEQKCIQRDNITCEAKVSVQRKCLYMDINWKRSRAWHYSNTWPYACGLLVGVVLWSSTTQIIRVPLEMAFTYAATAWTNYTSSH